MQAEKIAKQVEAVLNGFFKTSVSVSDTTDLVLAQGLDSLGLIELISTLEDEFDTSLEIESLDQLRSPADVYKTMRDHLGVSEAVAG